MIKCWRGTHNGGRVFVMGSIRAWYFSAVNTDGTWWYHYRTSRDGQCHLSGNLLVLSGFESFPAPPKVDFTLSHGYIALTDPFDVGTGATLGEYKPLQHGFFIQHIRIQCPRFNGFSHTRIHLWSEGVDRNSLSRILVRWSRLLGRSGGWGWWWRQRWSSLIARARLLVINGSKENIKAALGGVGSISRHDVMTVRLDVLYIVWLWVKSLFATATCGA